MASIANLSKLFSDAGKMLSHEVVARHHETGATSYDVVYQHENGVATCKSVGGQSHTRYEWHWQPKPAERNIFLQGA